MLLSTVLLGAGAAAVHAETEPSPAPTESVAPPPSPTPTPTPTPPPPALTINAPADGGFSQKRTITVSGDKAADSGVAVTIGAADLCTIPISPSTSWGCNLTLSSGADIPITATEILADSTLGDQVTVQVDVLLPPTITSTSPQSSPGVASGAGYRGSLITLLVGDGSQECTAPVTGSGE